MSPPGSANKKTGLKQTEALLLSGGMMAECHTVTVAGTLPPLSVATHVEHRD